MKFNQELKRQQALEMHESIRNPAGFGKGTGFGLRERDRDGIGLGQYRLRASKSRCFGAGLITDCFNGRFKCHNNPHKHPGSEVTSEFRLLVTQTENPTDSTTWDLVDAGNESAPCGT